MYLKRDRRSFSSGRSSQRFPFTRKRPARTPPSTFLFLPIQFSNSPETWRSPFPVAGKSYLVALEAQGFRSTSEAAFTMKSEMLLQRAYAPRWGGRPVVRAVYRVWAFPLSTTKQQES